MKINQAWLEKRRQELAIMEQMEIESQLRRQEARAEEDAFLRRVHNRRAAQERGEDLHLAPVPTFDQIFQQKRSEELAERAEAERLRIESMTPRDRWFMALSYQDRLAVQKWELVNGGMHYPVVGLD